MANRGKAAGKKNIAAGKPSDSRAGKRRDRNKRVGARVPELGYYLIVTDTEETEKNYFEGLRDSIPAELKDRLVIKVEKARTVELVKKALEMTGQESQYRIPWIVFDRDQVKDFDEIIQTAEKSGVGAGWSNPCFEIWMYAYFGEMPVIRESFTCCDRFAEKFEKITGVFIRSWCSMEMKKRRFRWRRDVIKDVWKMENENHRRCGRLVGYIGWWKKYKKK